MLFALLVEHWCLIKSFSIAGPVCGDPNGPYWFYSTKEAKLWCFVSCLTNFRLGRPPVLIKFVFCYIIFKNRLYLSLVCACMSKISRFYPIHLLNWSNCSCVANFWREPAPEVDADQSHRLLWTMIRRNTIHQLWIQTLHIPLSPDLLQSRERPKSQNLIATTKVRELFCNNV